MYNLIQKLFEPKTNCTEAAKLFADLLQVKITESTLRQSIEEHPDYPSLLSISDVLNSYGIANISAKFDKNSFFEVPPPFITGIQGERRAVNFFAVVSDKNNNKVRFYNHENTRWETCSTEDFYNRTEGIVLMAEVGENAGEKDYQRKVKSENRKLISISFISICLPLALLFSGVVSLIRHGMNAILPFTFSVLTLAGAIIGILLILYELDQYTPVLQKICRPTHKVNCSAVLNSKGSKIAGMSWATIGFTYFSGQMLLLLFLGITDPRSLFMVSWLNLLAAPFILFSIFYQWRVVKQWCVLCLSVQLILLLQLTTALIARWHTAVPVNEVLIDSVLVPAVLAMLIPFISVSLLVPAYREAKGGKSDKLQLQRIKHNPQVFEALLTKQKRISNSTKGLGILLGNPNATMRIVKVCNPYCGPCSESHKAIDDLLDNNYNLQVQIIFLTSGNKDDIRTQIARHLMAIAEKCEETTTRKALDNWYLKNKDYERFAEMYPLNGELQKQIDKVEVMQNWCNETGIEFTPTFFVNGYQLPKMYNVADLKYFLTT